MQLEHIPIHPTNAAFYQSCYRCHAVVENGLVTRRMQLTGYSTGWQRLYHYDAVLVCGVCAQEIDEAGRKHGWFALRWLGVLIGTIALTGAGVLWPVSLLTMVILARLRLVGRALIAMYVTAKWVQVDHLPPTQYLSHFVLPWAVMMGGVLLGEVLLKRPWKKLTWKRPLLIGGHR